MVIASPQVEAMLKDVLVQRVHADLPIPALTPGHTLLESTRRGFDEMLNPEARSMRYFDGTMAITDGDARDLGDECPFENEQTTLAFHCLREDVQDISGSLFRLERALPGAAETVMARLTAANKAAFSPVALPHSIHEIAECHLFPELSEHQLAPNTVDGRDDYTSMDEEVKRHYIEDCGGSEDEDFALPSQLFEPVCGFLGFQRAINPAVRCALTEEAFVAAGFTAAQAVSLVQRLEVDLPALTERLSAFSAKRPVIDYAWEHFAVAAVLGNAALRATQMLDEVSQQRAEIGLDDCLLRVAAVPTARKKIKGTDRYKDTKERLDGLQFMADYLNTLGHLDQILKAISH